MSRAAAVAGGLLLPGLVVAHLLAYSLAYPDAHVRVLHLDATGHAAFSLLVFAGAAVLPVLAARAAARAVRNPVLPVPHIIGRLAVLQGVAFVALESAERGMAPHAALVDPAVLLGVALQLPVAAVAVCLLALFMHGVHVLAHALRPLRPLALVAPAFALPPARVEHDSLHSGSAWRSRAPPFAPSHR